MALPCARGSQQHSSLLWGFPPTRSKIRHFSSGEQALFHKVKKIKEKLK